MKHQIDKHSLSDFVQRELGASDWLLIDQQRINSFADDTLDHQYIHVDPEKAATTPFGGTIAHGMLVLSLLPHFYQQCGVNIEGSNMAINYGFDKVRFLTPVAVNSQVRGNFKLISAQEKKPGQIQMRYEVSVEVEGMDTPALIAEWLIMVFI